MTTVFIAGSIKIKKLHPKFVERISNILSDKMDVVVGDANGADAAIQRELYNQQAENVTVYCTGTKPRNNVGNWKVVNVQSSAETGTRAFFTAKDLKMAGVADYGLMLWDTASTGTLSNIFELLKGGKKSVVFVNKDQHFVYIKGPRDIEELVSIMSDGAKAQAERKVGLRSMMFQLTNRQIGLPL